MEVVQIRWQAVDRRVRLVVGDQSTIWADNPEFIRRRVESHNGAIREDFLQNASRLFPLEKISSLPFIRSGSVGSEVTAMPLHMILKFRVRCKFSVASGGWTLEIAQSLAGFSLIGEGSRSGFSSTCCGILFNWFRPTLLEQGQLPVAASTSMR